MKRILWGFFFFTLGTLPALHAQLVFSMLHDATIKAREICEVQPQPDYQPDSQEKTWLNAESHRRWGVGWSQLATEGAIGSHREALLYQWLAVVELSKRRVPPAPSLADSHLKEDSRIAALASPESVPNSD